MFHLFGNIDLLILIIYVWKYSKMFNIQIVNNFTFKKKQISKINVGLTVLLLQHCVIRIHIV